MVTAALRLGHLQGMKLKFDFKCRCLVLRKIQLCLVRRIREISKGGRQLLHVCPSVMPVRPSVMPVRPSCPSVRHARPPVMPVRPSCLPVRHARPSVMPVRPSCLSVRHTVCLSAWNNTALTGQILIKFGISIYPPPEKLLRKFYENLTNIAGTVHEDRYTFLIISRSVLLRIGNISDESRIKNQNTHFIVE